jgi:hypothetical protein
MAAIVLGQACGGAATSPPNTAQDAATAAPATPAEPAMDRGMVTGYGEPPSTEVAQAPGDVPVAVQQGRATPTAAGEAGEAPSGAPETPGEPPTPEEPADDPQTLTPKTGSTTLASGEQTGAARRRAMLDIEAHLTVEVSDIRQTARRLRELTLDSGGDIVKEQITDQVESPRAEFTLRIPIRVTDDFLDAIEAIGAVKSRNVVARDIGKEYFDAALRLKGLRWALARYEKILEQANNVDEILRVEQEIARLQSQIEQVEGQLRWMRDRAARATVHVALQAPGSYVAPIVRPEAKLYPGLRVTYLSDFRGEDGNAGYLGGGFSLRLSRHLGLDIEGLRASDGGDRDLDLLLLTLGGEMYSEYFGDGKRRWFNPYLGFRAGYARFLSKDEIAAGGGVGVEVFKTEVINVDAEARILALFGSDAGVHLAVQPALGVNVAF